uniref:urea transporter 1-like isoform X1 n=1 Tax=Gasterosteus aculeatus aculeatus TaxID=481459 RepID=UPI001A987814|nr:urea transporter 1-like isoform X1 [Gasterosteus aculeatus aculeatus]XP_040053565.1 urea transporter 1-like isoform X1 [Gasterosteus aculeatus aculeatus]
MSSSEDGVLRPPQEGAPTCSSLSRAVGLVTGDMRLCREWVKRQPAVVQLLDWTCRGVAQVMFVNNPLSGLLVTAGLFLQDPWWALSGLLATFVSTASAFLLGQNREAISVGLHGYNGTLIGILMAVFSAKGSWYWWLLLPNMFLSMLCPVVSSALSSVACKWDLPILTLPFNMLVCLHVAATGANHHYFPQADMQPKDHLHPANDSMESLDVSRVCDGNVNGPLFLSLPVGVGQVYGCSSPWTGSLILLALLLSSPTICAQAMWGSAVGMLSGLALAAPREDIYSGLWGYNCALSCVAIGGVFYVITWKTHLLALTCALFCAYLTAAISKLMSMLALPACTWPFCLSTLIFLLVSSETAAICRLPLSVVSYPEENRRCRTRLEASEKAPLSQLSGSQDEVQFGPDSSCREALCH